MQCLRGKGFAESSTVPPTALAAKIASKGYQPPSLESRSKPLPANPGSSFVETRTTGRVYMNPFAFIIQYCTITTIFVCRIRAGLVTCVSQLFASRPFQWHRR
jgi:hypothetical protein